MGSLKRIVVGPIKTLAASSGLSATLAKRQHVYRIVMLHGIGADFLTREALERQLIWLARAFKIVALDEVIAKVAAGTPAQDEVAITFDDGLACHALVVAPVLQRLQIPATFFVCPTLIDEHRWLWNHEARERLSTLSAPQRSELAAEIQAPAHNTEAVIAWMKTLPLSDRTRVESTIRTRTPSFVATSEQHASFDPLTWEQFRAFESPLFTIGSHSSTHPILPTLDDDILERELVGSRAAIEQRLQRPIDLFCYPNGSQDPRVRAVTARTYRAAVSTIADLVRPGDDLHSLARIPIADEVAAFAWRMHRPDS